MEGNECGIEAARRTRAGGCIPALHGSTKSRLILKTNPSKFIISLPVVYNQFSSTFKH